MSKEQTRNSRRIHKKEKWSDVISKLNLDLNNSVNYVSAEQIKQISHEEPRLMAKMDRIEQLPKVFKDNNLVLFPISRKGYVIVKGKGYHELEEITESLLHIPPNILCRNPSLILKVNKFS